MIATRTLLSTVVLLGFSAGLVAQAPALDIKYGLWENTIVTSMGGAPPVDTSKMTPEQAAQMAAAMKAMGERTMTQKSCLKKEDVAKDTFMLPSGTGTTCTRTVTTNSKASYIADVHCTGASEMKGQVNIAAGPGGTSFTGAVKMDTSARGRAMTVTMKMSGKYLGADCGDVK